MRVAVMTANDSLREGLYLQILACGGIPVDLEDGAEAVLVDAGTGAGAVTLPDTGLPALVMVTPNARGSLKDMRAMGFTGYLVKPVRQSSLMTQLLLCRGVAVPAAGPDMTAPPEIARPRFTGGLRILLAEDNAINMMLIRELLRRRGHTVSEVTTGNDAVEAVLDGDYDLLLTDIHMPGMDGIEATRAIRAGEVRFGKVRTPIVALTADVLEAGKQSCLEAGMDGFLTKPVDPAELEEIFLALFAGGEPSHIVAA
jgi:CheY-like chemotaxis protein